MREKMVSGAAFADTMPHYELLDALRGVAALLVLWYHVNEGFAFAGGGVIRGINHGYLAVDFFFILSGFVISYAYDGRWRKKPAVYDSAASCRACGVSLGSPVAADSGQDSAEEDPSSGNVRRKPLTMKEFFRRRIVRLHPMVVLGAVIGAVTFCIQGAVQWDGSHVAVSAVMAALLFAMFMIPAVPGQVREVRGNGEMFPLNGPAWSLFFEYIGNILYALIIRRLSNKALGAVTAVPGILLAWFAMFDISGYGSLGVGWTLDAMNFWGGFLRMSFPFTLGMLISRNFKPAKVKGALWICTAILAALFFVPYAEGSLTLWTPASGEPAALSMNGMFEMFCIAVAFPVVLWLGASGNAEGRWTSALCRFLGDISFPLYIVHYPFMYLFYAWLLRTGQYTLAETWPVAIGVCLWNILFAWLCLKFYDEPARRWLNKVTRQLPGDGNGGTGNA